MSFTWLNVLFGFFIKGFHFSSQSWAWYFIKDVVGGQAHDKRNELTKYLDTRFHSIKDVDEEDETLWNTLEMRPTRKEEDGLISCFFLDFFSFTNRHIYLIHGKWRQAVSVQKKEEKETNSFLGLVNTFCSSSFILMKPAMSFCVFIVSETGFI